MRHNSFDPTVSYSRTTGQFDNKPSLLSLLLAKGMRGPSRLIFFRYPQVDGRYSFTSSTSNRSHSSLFFLFLPQTRPFWVHGWLNAQLRNVTQIYWPLTSPSLSFSHLYRSSPLAAPNLPWKEDDVGHPLSIPPFDSLWIPLPGHLTEIFIEGLFRDPSLPSFKLDRSTTGRGRVSRSSSWYLPRHAFLSTYMYKYICIVHIYTVLLPSILLSLLSRSRVLWSISQSLFSSDYLLS